MGWDYGPKPHGVKAYCDSRLTWESDDGKRRVLDSAMLCRYHDLDGPRPGDIILTKEDVDNG